MTEPFFLVLLADVMFLVAGFLIGRAAEAHRTLKRLDPMNNPYILADDKNDEQTSQNVNRRIGWDRCMYDTLERISW